LSLSPSESVLDLFADFRPRIVPGKLSDFSGLHTPEISCLEVAPRSAATLARIVQLAGEHGIPLRIRAQGHSLNGSSLPREKELLISTRNLRQLHFEEPGSVTVGSGVVLWVLQHMLRRYGYDLPVLNDGYAGPTVGGYTAAGGFGPRSSVYGGFWDNVLEMQFVDGLGKLHRVTPAEAIFPWLFGSMGQLGVLINARLAIVAREGSSEQAPYPAGTTLQAPELLNPPIPPEFDTSAGERLFWFTLFTPDEYLKDAQQALTALERRHNTALRFQDRYRYPIRQHGRIAPLVYPYVRPFTATGAWGWLIDGHTQGITALNAFDRDFMALATSTPHYRRYVQSELPCSPEVYRHCFGETTYEAFRRHKSELDPRAILNRGTVFE
jgi:FAD/FMN-containing dehydrogenase